MSGEKSGLRRRSPGESVVDGGSEDRVVGDRKPDGGWGWAVTAGVFIVFVITTGSSWSFGILYIAFLDAFDESKAMTAVPGSLIFMTMVVTNPYAGLLADRFGHRPIIFLGGVLSSVAIFASSFADDFTTLTVLYGFFGGIGYGLSHLPAVVMLSRYFDTKIGTATGIAMAGTGLGTIFMSVVIKLLVDEYGWRGTMMVMSAINLNLCVAAATMRPLTNHRRPRVSNNDKYEVIANGGDAQKVDHDGNKYKEIPQTDSSCNHIKITVNPTQDHSTDQSAPNTQLSNHSDALRTLEIKARSNGYSKVSAADDLNGDTRNCSNGTTCTVLYDKAVEAELQSGKADEAEIESRKLWCGFVRRRVCRPVFRFFDSVYGFAIWKNPMYLSFLLGINLNFFGMTVVSAHVAKRALEFGIPSGPSSFLVAVLGMSQAAGRFLSGPLIDRCHLHPLRLYQAMAGLGGSAILVSIYLPSFAVQVAFCVIAGYTTGSCATLQTVLCGSLFGGGKLKFAYPGVILAVGIAMLSSPPIAGLCRDIQGNYVGAFYMAAAACCLSVLAHMPVSCTMDPRHNKKLSKPLSLEKLPTAEEPATKV